MNVKEILNKRAQEIVTVGLKTPIPDAARIMTEKQIGALVVVDTNDKIAGILSERDILAAVGDTESGIVDITTDQLMTRNVITCAPEDSVIQVILKFDALGIRHLVVMDDGDMAGVVSIRDVLEAFSRLILEKRIFGQQQFATEFAAALAAA